MANDREREILRQFIELYGSHRCLWDKETEMYKDKIQRTQAWNVLVEKLAEMDPKANIVVAKKRMEHMRTAYFREAKKIKKSKRTVTDASEVYIPKLWYYNFLNSVLEKTVKEERRSELDPLASDEVQRSSIDMDLFGDAESDESEQERARNISIMTKSQQDRILESKKLTFYETPKERIQQTNPQYNKKQDSFVIYVGEQLEQVDKFQRHVAEKLISETLFLAKTGNLTFDTKIETPSGSRARFNSGDHSYSQSPSPRINPPSPSYAAPLVHIIQLADPSPTEETDTNCNTVYYEETGKSVLKDLLIHRKSK